MSNTHYNRFKFTQGVREFFLKNNFLDCQIPPMVPNPGMETHIHPFQITSAKSGKSLHKYLQTSPEFYMKELLAEGLEDIFTIGYSFRDEPSSKIHRSQFLLLEWYRTNENYKKIMDDCESLILYLNSFIKKYGLPIKKRKSEIKFERVTVQELFREYLKVDILNFLEVDSIRELITKDFKEIPLPPGKFSWDDYYFLLFLNKIEPELVNYPYLLIYEYPHHLSALATLKESDRRVCERFEIYMDGIELCNCFNELRDIDEQKKRFEAQAIEKKLLYGYELPSPTVLYSALEKGFPPAAGIALGIERLYHVLSGETNIFWN